MTSEGPDKLDKSRRDAGVLARSVDQLAVSEDELVGDISNHLVDASSLVQRLLRFGLLTDQRAGESEAVPPLCLPVWRPQVQPEEALLVKD